MAFAFFSLKGGDDRKLEDDEIVLGEPHPDLEAHSLAVHVNRCAARYRVTIRRLNKMDRSQDRLFVLVMFVLITVIVLSPPVSKALGLT